MAFVTTLDGIAARFASKPEPLVWAYVRVSDDSHEDNESPDVQRDAILAYCEAKQLTVPVVVYEKASAAKPLFTVRLPGMRPEDVPVSSPRPLLSTLIARLCERRDTHLIIWKLDRLSRVATEQDMLFSFFERHAITLGVAYASESFLTDSGASADPVRVLMRQVLGAFAQYERHLIQMRMKLGTHAKYTRGGWVGGGLPFGYKVHAGDLVIDPAKAEVVRLVFSLIDGAKMSFTEAVKYLQDHGYVGFHRMKIARILHNRSLYRGTLVDPTGAPHARPDLQILKDPVVVTAPDDSDDGILVPTSVELAEPELEMDPWPTTPTTPMS